MIRIKAKAIPHDHHRYPTAGDYWTDEEGVEQVRTSALSDWRMEFLILLHEQVEMMLCKHRGIAEPDIKAFDEMFERERAEGKHSEMDEPGFDPRAPYKAEHQFATDIEYQMAEQLGVDWDEYERIVSELP